MAKLGKPTKKGLREYLEANPDTRHQCSDFERCVIANYYADVLMADTKYKAVSVDGAQVDLWKEGMVGEDGRYLNPDLSVELPTWADVFISRFDDLPRLGARGRYISGVVTSKAVLKELGNLL